MNDVHTHTLLTALAESILTYYQVDEPPVPIERMLQAPPQGMSPIDTTQISFTIGHGLYKYEPRLAMGRLLCREIARNLDVQHTVNVNITSLAYTDLRFFARTLLMPLSWLEAITRKRTTLEEISQTLQVPLYAVVTRLAELDLPIPNNR